MRDFMDSNGVAWHVWSTVPSPANRQGAPVEAWLTFEDKSTCARRRLTPIPDGWEYASASTLASFCARAIVVPATWSELSWRPGESPAD